MGLPCACCGPCACLLLMLPALWPPSRSGQVIERHPCLDKPDIGWDDPGWAVFMGFEHERIQ